MGDWLSLLPQIILAQAMGVGLAWVADAVSWKVRREGTLVGAFNVFGLLLSLFFVGTLLTEGLAVASLILTMLWLIIVTCTQTRQLGTSFRTTFFEAMMQLVCFVWALFVYFEIIIVPARLTPAWSILLLLVSATLTHVLLSLFRPTIYGAWNTWRRNSGKN